ncbi:MAG: glycosyltransferase, partial [Deltaproteobacteria bacterium]|nr:glycosyltransferase [Deltaproteobacteria bacterium]
MEARELNKSPRHPARVLLVAAACNPYRGSDFKVGWGRVQETAKYFDTWVICGSWDQEDIFRYSAEHGLPSSLHFCFVEEGWVARLLKRRHPLFYTNLFAYYLWQRRAFKLAVELHRRLNFALTHQATLVGYREPGFLWKLEVPFVWGPVGGTQNCPWRFLLCGGLDMALVEGGRSLINWLQLRLSRRVQQAARRATGLLAANSQIKKSLERIHRGRATVLLETGISEVLPAEALNPKPHQPFRLLWSGDFKHHKALPLLLQALSSLTPDFPYELRILGRGPLDKRWRKLAQRLGINDRCRWLGWLPLTEAMRQYDWADVLVFTSLRDTSGNVVLEALSQGVPVVCLDHQGVGDIITPECGIKIPVTTPKKVIAGLKEAIVSLATQEGYLQSLSRGALKRAQNYLWSANGAQMASIYLAAMATGQNRPVI